MPRRWSRVVLLCLPALAVSCAPARPPGSPPISPAAANGQAVVTVLGTPLHALFKATACFASALIAVPSSAALALTDRPERVQEREALHEGLGRNCYGSYLLRPV